jgi:hypothetical protein
MEKHFSIRNREAGTVIEEADTLTEALKVISKYENEDKANGTYEDGFYEVFDNVLEEVIF